MRCVVVSFLHIVDVVQVVVVLLLSLATDAVSVVAAADSSPSHNSLHSDDSASPSKSATMPARATNPLAPANDAQRHAYYASGVFGHPKGSSDQLPRGFVPTKTDLEAAHRVSLEANLATEVGIIVLDVIGVYMNKFKEKLEDNGGDNTKVCFYWANWIRVNERMRPKYYF